MSRDVEAQAVVGLPAAGDGLPAEGYVGPEKARRYYDVSSPATFWRMRKAGIVPPPDISSGTGKLDRWNVETIRAHKPPRRSRSRKTPA